MLEKAGGVSNSTLCGNRMVEKSIRPRIICSMQWASRVLVTLLYMNGWANFRSDHVVGVGQRQRQFPRGRAGLPQFSDLRFRNPAAFFQVPDLNSGLLVPSRDALDLFEILLSMYHQSLSFKDMVPIST